jgi:hypothetical protein
MHNGPEESFAEALLHIFFELAVVSQPREDSPVNNSSKAPLLNHPPPLSSHVAVLVYHLEMRLTLHFNTSHANSEEPSICAGAVLILS